MNKTSKMLAISCLILFTNISCNNATKNGSNYSENKMGGTSQTLSIDSNTCMKVVGTNDSAKYISKQLEVTGDVVNKLALNVDSLKLMPTQIIQDYKVVCQSGATMKIDKTCKGVLLKDIITKAQLNQLNHKDRNFYFVARATDNYKATFSWGEIFNNPTGDSTYVLYEENGMPITTKGAMILICKNDIKTGPRHVFWLKSIEVNKVK